jgi:hypothetical protein
MSGWVSVQFTVFNSSTVTYTGIVKNQWGPPLTVLPVQNSMSLTRSQLEALEQVQQILDSAGLSPISAINSDFALSPSPQPDTTCPPDLTDSESTLNSAPACHRTYQSPAPYYFTKEEILQRANYINRASKVSAVVDHLIGAIVEYPTTAPDGIAHRFVVDPASFIPPQSAFQYSLGGGQGGRENAVCLLLRDEAGKPARCRHLKLSCMYLLTCSQFILSSSKYR